MTAAERLPARSALERRVRATADVGDHEQEHDHHGAGVHEHLRRGDELRREQQVQDGERGEVSDQGERGEERVREADHCNGRAEAAAGRDGPNDPDEDVAQR